MAIADYNRSALDYYRSEGERLFEIRARRIGQAQRDAVAMVLATVLTEFAQVSGERVYSEEMVNRLSREFVNEFIRNGLS